MKGIRAAGAIVIIGILGATAASAQEIHMKTRTFSPPAGDRAVNSATPASARGNGRSVHQIIAFNHPVGVNDLDALNVAGAQVTGILPDNAVVISTAGGMNSRPAGTVWIGSMEARDKVSPILTANAVNATGSQVPVIVEFHSDVDAADQAALETSLGLTFTRPAGLMANHAILYADPGEIALLASQDEVAYIFPAEAGLLTGLNAYPCAGMLTTAGPVAQYSNVIHGWSLDSDNAAHLSYYFGSLTVKVPAATVQSEILRAFAAWASKVNVTFQPATSSNAPRSIFVQFASGAHGDSYPFDGPGHMLGHTFYPAPINSEPVAGNMHFDADETWGVGSNTDIYTVALHEIGHALGLGHSDNPNDVMFPYYQPGRALSSNDIGAALELYPAAGQVSTPVTVTSVPVPPVTSTPVPPVTATPTTGAAPLALVINPPPATTKSAGLDLNGTLTGGKGNGTVQWQTDHGYTGTATLAASGAWTSNDIPLVTGANTVTVLAYDAADQVTTKTATVTLQQPGAAVVSPITISTASPVSPVVTVKTSTITITGKASGGAGVTSVTWQTSNGATGTACGTDTWVAAGIPVPAVAVLP